MGITSNSTCRDDAWGPTTVEGCRDNFDFTLLFEQTILSILPSALLILSTPIRLYQLVGCSVKTIPTTLLASKAGATIALLAVRASLLGLWTSNPSTQASIPMAALSLFVATCIIVLTAIEHMRAVRPSSLLNLYLIISIPLDISQIRTLYLRHETAAIVGLSTACVFIKLILFVLENQNKQAFLKAPYRDLTSWARGGIVNRTFFYWLTPTFWKGFRALLAQDDLSQLDEALLSEVLQYRIEGAWAKYSGSGRYGLLRTLAWAFRRQLLMTIVPRTCLIGFNYAQPFLIGKAVTYVGDKNASENYGYGLIGAAILIYSGLAISTSIFQHALDRGITMIRGGLVTLIYSNTLKLQSGVYDESKAITLMSTDIDMIANNVEDFQEIWARLAEIGIGIWLLERQLGWVCLAPILVILACTGGALRVAKFTRPAMTNWVSAIQRRVGMTSSMLGAMKSIKMMGLTETLSNSIQNQRVRELDLSAKFRWLNIFRNVISFTPALLGPLLTFVIFTIEAYARGTSNLSTAQAFTSLAIISLLSAPSQGLLNAIPSVTTALACFDRIQAFLLAEPWSIERAENELHELDGVRGSISLVPRSLLPSTKEAISIENVYVKPHRDSSFILQSINLKFTKGSFTMIIGPVGCGKSTLLKAILGELSCDTGRILTMFKRMAYCSQTPWLPNATVRQIICGGIETPIDQQWYDSVIHGCALEEDLLQLPDGHHTIIGSRGVTLSGGQKQRLALARAAYARQEIVLLDDTLSALDANTEALVLSRLFGEGGIFRKAGSTVILATHGVWNLSQADNIIVLDGIGSVTAQGTLDYLKMQEGILSDIVHRQVASSAEKDSNAPLKKGAPLPQALRGPSPNDIEDLTRRTGDVSVYKYYFAAMGSKILFGVVACVFVNTLAASFPQVWLKWFTEGTIQSIPLFTSMYVVFVITSLIMVGTSMVIMFLYGIPRSGARLHQILLTSVMGAPQSFFDKTDSGITLNRFSQDMTLIDGILPGGVIITLQALFNCIASAGLISSGSSYMGLTIPGLVLCLYLLQNIYLRTSRQMRLLDLEAKGPLYTNFQETLEGLPTIRAFGWEARSIATNTKRLDASQRPYYLMKCIQRWLNLVLQLLIGAMAVIVVGLAVSLRTTTSGGNLGISLTSVLTFNTNVEFLLTWWTHLETSLGAIARTKNFAEQTAKEDKPEETFLPDQKWPIAGGIQFQSVTASYGEDVVALRDVSLNIAPGEKVGIVGRTGSGKSSMLSVLLRILDYESGSIVIDGVDLSLVPRSIIRSRLITVPQDPFVLGGSVRLNADPTESVPDDQIIAAMTKVKLWETLNERGGLDVEMTARPLSQGQQQLFCLGRALLRTGGKILVLDEATSSTNVETDQLMRDLIREEFKHHTVLTVAHRMTTIMECDKVALMEKGMLVAFGSPEELLEHNADFRALYHKHH